MQLLEMKDANGTMLGVQTGQPLLEGWHGALGLPGQLPAQWVTPWRRLGDRLQSAPWP